MRSGIKLLFTLLFAFLSLTAFGQTTANIVGVAQDEAGAVVQGAKITATNLATGVIREAVTDDRGIFLLSALPIGNYRVRCEKEGFKVAAQENVVLQIAQEVRLNFTLSVGQTTETVTITSSVALTNTENAELGEVIENRRIVDLPLNGRNFLQLAELTPGISRGSTGGFRGGLTGNLTGPDITVNGARATDNYFTIDGVSANDRFFNSLVVTPSVDAIQEFKVQSNLYSPESGVTGGAQINIAIKSGSNDFHGSLFEFFRNDRLNARNFFHNIGRANGNRPDLKGDPNAGPKKAEQWFNTAAFVNPVRGVFGAAGRSIVDGDTYSSVDFSTLKDIFLTEKLKLQFRAEIFNLLNHANFGTPNRNYLPVATGYQAGVFQNTNPDFGRVFGAEDPRVAQIALKLIF
jgi:hypothetical protein